MAAAAESAPPGLLHHGLPLVMLPLLLLGPMSLQAQRKQENRCLRCLGHTRAAIQLAAACEPLHSQVVCLVQPSVLVELVNRKYLRQFVFLLKTAR